MLVCGSGVVHADEQVADRRTQVVNVSAIDLQSEAGRRETYSRLRVVAKRVCAEVDGRRTLDDAVSYARCVKDTLDAAVAQVHDPVFQEYAARRANGQRKAVIAAAAK